MNALLTKKLLGEDTDFQLPTVIWQDNTAPQTWLSLDNFGEEDNFETFSLGQEEQVIQNQYSDKDFERYGKTYQTFNTDLYQGKANQITIDLPVTKNLHLNGRAQLNLRIKSSTYKGLLSAQLLETWTKEIPTTLSSCFKCYEPLTTVATTCWKISVNCLFVKMRNES